MAANSIDAESDEAARKRAVVDTLYRRYSDALRKFLGRQRVRREEVADIVQETYYRLQRSAELESITQPKAFIFRVAKNVHLNAEKHRCYGVEDDSAESRTLDVDAEEPDVYRRIQAEQEWAVVCAAIDELPPTCRDAFVMHRFENMSYPQIAAELGLSVSMIEKYISHAIAHMRKRRASMGVSRGRRLLRSLK